MKNIDETFEKILEDHGDLIRKVCQLYTDTEQDLKDSMQEVALQLWKSYPTFEGRSKLSTWIYRVALNVCLSQIRVKTRKPTLDQLPADAEIEEQQDEEEIEEQSNQLHKAIKQLDELDRAIILQYLEGLSYREISEIMGISVSNVGVKIHRIKEQLKEMIHG